LMRKQDGFFVIRANNDCLPSTSGERYKFIA
jgi:hypothetical protein